MTESKAKKMIVASTVGAVLLLVILLSIMVYQMISIQTERHRIAQYYKQIAEYERLIKNGEETIEVRQMREWIEREARKLGLTYEGENN